MKGVAIAAALGAGISGFLYLTVKFGIDLGYRMYDKQKRQQAALERTQP